MMKKLRWAMDGDFWEMDLSTPATLDGVARPSGDGVLPLPLGLSRGARLSRPKQIDFFQRFMAVPLLPSFSHGVGLSLQRLLSLPLPYDTLFATLVGQFNVQKFVASVRRNGLTQATDSDSSLLQNIWKRFSDPKFYALNFCCEWLLTPQDKLMFTSEADADATTPRNKAILHHKFPSHNLTVEASSPALYVDHLGNYWDVPLSLAIDLSSVASDSGTTCHFCINHNTGSPRQVGGQPLSTVPPTLLPGLCSKCAVSMKKDFSIWRSEAPKTKMVLPYDIFLSNPHISASAILGGVISASVGENSAGAHSQDESFRLCAKGTNYGASADLFASASLSAQFGNFQKLFLDLTRFHARVDIPSGTKFIKGASKVALALYHSQSPSVEAIRAISPSATLSFQQQIGGPFSLRVDAGVSVDPKKEGYLNVDDPVFAVEYALQVLGSAKAVAWYSPKQREFMIELRFYET